MKFAIAAAYFLTCFVASGVALNMGGRERHNYYISGFFVGLLGIFVTAIIDHMGGF